MAEKTKAVTKFNAESAAAAGPSPAMLALFQTKDTAKLDKLERRNMPAMVKPGDVPMDGVVSGEIMKIVESPVTTIKGKLLWLRHESGQEFTFPCTGVIRNALAPGVDGEKLDKALQAEVGKMFYAKRAPDRQNTKYKKAMFMFDVFTSAK